MFENDVFDLVGIRRRIEMACLRTSTNASAATNEETCRYYQRKQAARQDR